MKKAITSKLVAAYSKTLNPNSKWYNEDLNSFKQRVAGMSEKELTERLGRMESFTDESSRFNRNVRKEVKRMDNAGMFNPSSLAAKNALS